MKRYILIALVFIVLIFILTACSGSDLSKPNNGTYKSEGLIPQTWTFSGTNKITMSTVGGLVNSSGTYRIDGERLYITSTLWGSESTTAYTITEITSKSFFIDGTKFIKQ